MARFSRLEVITRILDSGLIPLFYNGDVRHIHRIGSRLFARRRDGDRVHQPR